MLGSCEVRLAHRAVKPAVMIGIIRNSTITCPHCGFAQREEMPVDACLFFYDCKKCGARLRPKDGDCCVFCSFGSAPCPPKQAGWSPHA
jgi:DNA-directed RNA polymerase subunit RPC12/RpoP